MPYPESPFGDDFEPGILVQRADDDETNVNEVNNFGFIRVATLSKSARLQIQIREITKWLCETPKITSFRINTLKADVGDIRRRIETYVSGKFYISASVYDD